MFLGHVVNRRVSAFEEGEGADKCLDMLDIAVWTSGECYR